MTAVLRLRSNETGYPIMMGDLLLSVSDFPTNVSVPTKNSALILPAGSGKVPFGLRQKLSIISDDLVIGWAGNSDSARQLVEDLRKKNEREPFTFETLRAYLGSLVNLSEVSFTGFIKNGECFQSFDFDCETISSNPFGEICVIGTGAKSIEKYLNGLDWQGDANAGNELTQSTLMMLSLSGSLLSSEIRTGFSLSKLFGAGYEIATVVDGAFTKVSDITYLFWDSWTDGDRVQIRFPNRSLKISYAGDILVIRVDILNHLGGKEMACDTQQFFISPVEEYVDPDDFNGVPPQSINSKFMCNYFAFRDCNRKETILTHAQCLGSEEPPTVKFIEDGWQIKALAVRDDYLDLIAERIRGAYH